jgi:hypothetical protein
MNLDIRLPIGLLFAIIGALLAIYGVAFSDKAIYERSLGININFWWGAILFAFGAIMFWLGRRGTSSVQPADETKEGRKMEELEKRTGKENRKRGGH